MPEQEHMSFYSIIIPTFNSGATLKTCLESVLSQNFGDFEVVIEDGLSKDNTLEVAAAFGDNRIKVFSEADKGVYDAMNKAVSRASGQWLFFLGSDDVFYNAEVLQAIKQQLDRTSAALVYGDVEIIGNSSWAKDGQIYMGEVSSATLFTNNICHQAIFYSKKIFQGNNRYNLKYSICADYDFNLLCASRYKMEYVPVVVVFFKSGGLSTAQNDAAFAQEKWPNIVRYFGRKLFDKDFSRYRNQIKSTISSFLKQSEFKEAVLAVRLYLYYKFRS